MTGVSCIICAYNEAHRIRAILDAVALLPSVDEIIVVNDGSTDETERILAGYAEKFTVISYPENHGKTYAMAKGIRAATRDTLLFLDADLAGLASDDVQDLLAPVLAGNADVSMSVRANSLYLYRLMGLDFVTGERVMPRALLMDAIDGFDRLPRWGAEPYMNRLILRNRLRIAIVKFRSVMNVRKFEKVGALRGFWEECKMVYDALSVMNPFGALMQMAGLLAGHRRYQRGLKTRASLPSSPSQDASLSND